ncbi:MAG: hypothetical protein ABJC36_11180 [Gemmatimonadales bacterium]
MGPHATLGAVPASESYAAGEPMLGPGAETVFLRRVAGTTYRAGATG